MKHSLIFAMVVFSFNAIGNEPSALSPTILNLPTGPGSISGLGESFTPLLNSGTSSQNIPLSVPPGIAGLVPDLSISYSSGYGNGIVGIGRILNIPYIQRQADQGLPEYDDSDTYIDQNGSELVKISENTYRTQFSESFSLYTKLDSGWQVSLPNGIQLFLGETASAQVVSGTSVFSWHLQKTTDSHGNSINYNYSSLDETNQIYLSSIIYAGESSENSQSITLDYELRQDTIINYKPGFELTTRYRLDKITTKSLGQNVRVYDLTYQGSTDWNPQTALQNIAVYNAEETLQISKTEFTYTQFNSNQIQIESIPSGQNTAFGTPDTDLIDLNQDGLPDVINTLPSQDQIWINKGVNTDGVLEWGKIKIMDVYSHERLSMANVKWADFNGDGQSNLITHSNNFTMFRYLDKELNWQISDVMKGINLPLDDPNVRLFDINNDKRVDLVSTLTSSSGDVFAQVVQLNLVEGWSPSIVLDMPYEMRGVRFSDENVRLADMNGDGLQDVVVVFNKAIYFYPSKGLQGFGNRVLFSNAPGELWNTGDIYLSDMNNDGMSDLVYLNGNLTNIWINKGQNSSDTNKASFTDTEISVTAPDGLSINSTTMVDINGNGSTDILWYSPDEYENTFVFAELFPDEQPNQLKTITNGIGAKTTLYYGALVDEMIRDREAGKPWQQGVPIGMQVLKRIEVEDGISDVIQTTNINYHNGFYHAQEKEFRGFGKSEEVISGDDSMPSLHTYSQYHLGKSNEVLKGLPKSVDVQDASGNSFYTETQTWNAKKLLDGTDGESRSVYFAELTQVDKTITEKGNGDEVFLKWNYEYDNYGNTTKITEHGRSDRAWLDERITLNRFSSENATSLENWMLNYPVETIVTDGSGTALSKQQWFYDDESFTASDLGAVTKGNLTLNKAWIDPGDDTSAINLVRQKFYDNGNVSDIYGPLWASAGSGHHTAITYDETFNAFPVTETIHSGTTSFTATSSYNFDYGTMASFTDFNNNTTSFKYDDFGRIKSIVKPGDSADYPTVTYDYKVNQAVEGGVVNWVETKQREKIDGGTLDSRIFYDGLGRTLLEKTEGVEAGKVVVGGQSIFNKRGAAFKSYLPYYSSTMAFNKTESGNAYTKQSFDELGRPLKAWTPFDENNSRSYSQWSYQPLVQLISDNEQTDSGSDHYGSYKRLIFDGLLNEEGQGRLVQVDEVVKLDENGEESSITAWSTLYEYDVLGNFTKLTDAQGNVRTMLYDGLNRNYFYNDPNRGYFWQAFDAASNVVASRDANGQEIHHLFDGANRVIAEYHVTPTQSDAVINERWQPVQNISGLNPVVTFEYDTINGQTSGASLGRLAKVNDAAGYSQYKFDSRGRVIEQSRHITGHGIHSSLYTSKREYDSSDRLTRYEYPDTTYLTYVYDNRGSLNYISGVVDNIEYTAAGQQSKREYSNGVEINYTYDSQQRLKTLLATRTVDSAQLQNLTYEFDALTNIKSITDGRSDTELHTIATEIDLDSEKAQELKQSFIYKYDDLYRLKEAESNLIKYQYQYDLIGNLKQRTSINDTGSAQVTHLRYGNSQTDENYGSFDRIGRIKSEVAGPHALTNTNGQDSYFYDDNGNLSQDGNLHYQWDHNNRLIKVSTQAPTSSRVQ